MIHIAKKAASGMCAVREVVRLTDEGSPESDEETPDRAKTRAAVPAEKVSQLRSREKVPVSVRKQWSQKRTRAGMSAERTPKLLCGVRRWTTRGIPGSIALLMETATVPSWTRGAEPGRSQQSPVLSGKRKTYAMLSSLSLR